jgi:hypothetical protein
MADRVTYRPSAELQSGGGGSDDASRTTSVEIRTKDGRTFSHQPDGVPGDARHPVDRELLEAKFRDCVSFSAQPVDPAAVERAIQMIWNLEKLGDVTQIVRTLTGSN